jgi:hypothetical protein
VVCGDYHSGDRAESHTHVNRYFFNFRQGNAVARDDMGMFLPDLHAAHAEALNTCHDLAFMARAAGEIALAGEVEVTDASGEQILRLPITENCTEH